MPNEQDDGSQNPSNETQYVKIEDIGNIVNAAVKSQLGRALTPALEAATKPLLEKLAAFQAPPPPTADEGEGTKKPVKQTPEMLAMAKKLEDMEKQLIDRDQKVEAAEKKARDQRGRADLRAALEGKVRPELLDLVAANLYSVENRIEFDETGTPLFKTSRSPYVGADPEDVLLPLKSGVEEYLKGESAKAFLPAPSPGSGAGPLPKRPASSPNPGFDASKTGSSDAEKSRRALEREQAAKARLGSNQ